MTRLIPAPPGLLLDESRRTKLRQARARGDRAEALAEEYYLKMGCLVARAKKALRWQFNPATGTRKPMSVAHDLFGLWDLCVVYPVGSSTPGRVEFVQVTSESGLPARRRKIAVSDWPQRHDVILVYLGRGLFRVHRGPEYRAPEPDLFRRPA